MQPDQTLSSATPAVREYIAILEQSSTNAPTATVLKNTLGGTVVWTRNGIGDYKGTLTAAFKSNKTLAIITNGGAYTDTANSYIDVFIYAAPDDEDNIWISSELDGQLSDGQMSKAPVIIYVYQ